ncbi:MAG: ral nucleoside transport system permease protein, partial [Ilumatobacteraceae bacterium]
MSDVGEHIITDPEDDEVASAALQRSKFGVRGEVVMLYAVCLFAALAIAAICVASTGGSWSKVFTAVLDGSIRAPGRWGLTLGVSAPILLVALGTLVNGRAGLVNIGQEGQLVIGASFAAYVAARLGGPGPIVLLISMACGVVGGAIWAGIAGALRYYRNVPEVLSTLLMGPIAANLMGFGLRNRWLLLAPPEGRANRNQVSKALGAHQRIPRLTVFGNQFPIRVFAAISLVALVWLVLDRSVVGFR